jgi:hypothetical protein
MANGAVIKVDLSLKKQVKLGQILVTYNMFACFYITT